MPLNNTNVPSSASDIVGVFDSDFNQVFPLARPIKCVVKETAKNMEHPVETGVTITDHRIILPTEIELSMILPAGEYRAVYQQIKQLWISAPLLSVQSRADTYDQMMIESIPHEEDPAMFDTIALAIRLKKVLFVSPVAQSLPASSVQNPVDQSTVRSGEQQPSAPMSLPPPVYGGPIDSHADSALPQIPSPPRDAGKFVPLLPPMSPINPAQYGQIDNAANNNGAP